jgi:hypothetical protein
MISPWLQVISMSADPESLFHLAGSDRQRSVRRGVENEGGCGWIQKLSGARESMQCLMAKSA